MVRLALLLAGVATLGMAAPATAAVNVYTANLTGAAERPVPVVTDGTGTATVIVNDVTNVMRVIANFSNLSSGVAAAHIHCCVGPEGTAGVATPVPSFPGFPSGVTSGSYNRTFDLLSASTYRPGFITANGGTVAGARAAFLAGLDGGLTYFNIHTGQFPGGEIRGQFSAFVPEPASWALMIAGFGLVGAGVRASKRRALPA
jgi:hypothetical protein